MPNYRLYTLDYNDKIIFGTDHDCDDDQVAIAMVRKVWAGGQRAEIWRGPFKIRPSAALDDADPERKSPAARKPGW